MSALRDRLDTAVGSVIFDASNYPRDASILGRNVSVLKNKTLFSVLEVLEGNDIDVDQEDTIDRDVQRNEWAEAVFSVDYDSLTEPRKAIVDLAIKFHNEKNAKEEQG